jgi:vancomycin resistance protein YoaR
VCQVGTTFFNTVFFSGLPIIERHNHSFYISHYPTGRDATVSWGGPDFKFKNDTKGWILIRTAVTASTLTISLYGTDPGYDVQYTTGPFTDVVPHGVQEVKDARLPVGRRVVEDPGVDGRTIVVKRTVYLAGVVVRQDSFVSHYNPKVEVVRVGTKPSTTPSGTPGP